ncbi:MAG: hypothetical protein AAB267_02905 [Candidatus Desantisbacteria bacterium]
MSITISLRVPDGIVLATDSLATVKAIPVPQENFVTCPQCTGRIPYSRLLTPPPTTFSASSTANKLFCLGQRMGIACFGVGFLTKRTMEGHLLEFGRKEETENLKIAEVVKRLEAYFRRELTCEIVDLQQIPEGEYPLGLQIAGYDADDLRMGKTFTLKIGRESVIEPVHEGGFGCTFGGDGRVILRLWTEDIRSPMPMPNYQLLSLQDAIEYVLFLVKMTIDAQRFAPMMPTCGGEIDVAVITPFSGFQWIKKKELKL